MSGALEVYRAARGGAGAREALERLRGEMDGFGAGEIAQVGRWLAKDLPALAPVPPMEVLLLGQCGTSLLPAPLRAWGWREGLFLRVTEGGYDQVLQDLQARTDPVEAVVLLPWHQRALAPDARTVDERVADELALLRLVWAEVARLRAKLVQISHDWTGIGPAGHALSRATGGALAVVAALNHAVRAELPAGAHWVDLEAVSGWHGRAHFYDARNYHWFKQPFSPAGAAELCRHVAAGLRVLRSGRKKVLVLDLDNTLWGGVVGEVGPHGVAVGTSGEGEAFHAFQHHVRQLRLSGVLLAACSKNNEADAAEPFAVRTDMPLKREDFAAWHVSWDAKPQRVRAMAEELNLGLDSFVFVDDNPAERAHMRAACPEVTVVELPADPSGYVAALEQSLAFETADLSAGGPDRTAQYAAEATRKQLAASAATPADYLASLDMRATLEPVGEANLARVVELITKTNQFNLTTRRHSRAAVEALLAEPGAVGLAVSLSDRFGDYGLVSVLLARPTAPDAWEIDSWLMSCRAMGRTLEHFVANALFRAARTAGIRTVTGRYLPTAKNAPVAELLSTMGFGPVAGEEGAWQAAVAEWGSKETAVGEGTAAG